ncbi:hypothetical protein [Sulfitobacter sp. JL08]|uniref:hypothetical protein n=1 Tax=Sulfitobacter sp. JL08 TaxID=2070369 RepID=UPI0013B46E0E|nr:hypothetical protein [Sulfitobacter sp. JL08]
MVWPIHTNGYRYVGFEAHVEADVPPQRARIGFVATDDDKRRGEFTIDGEQVCLGMPLYLAARSLDTSNRLGDNVGMQRA